MNDGLSQTGKPQLDSSVRNQLGLLGALSGMSSPDGSRTGKLGCACEKREMRRLGRRSVAGKTGAVAGLKRGSEVARAGAHHHTQYFCADDLTDAGGYETRRSRMGQIWPGNHCFDDVVVQQGGVLPPPRDVSCDDRQGRKVNTKVKWIRRQFNSNQVSESRTALAREGA